MREADDRSLGHRRMLVEHFLDLAGIHVVTAADDQVFGPVDDVEIAVLVDAADVPGGQPTIGCDGGPGRLREVPVALHHVVALDLDLAGLPGATSAPLGSTTRSCTPSIGVPIEPTLRGRCG